MMKTNSTAKGSLPKMQSDADRSVPTVQLLENGCARELSQYQGYGKSVDRLG